MVNIVWILLILIGLVVAAFNGKIEAVTQAALDNAKYAVELCFGLIGIYALWLGLMRVAEEAGLVKRVSRKMQGVMRFLFADIPARHHAIGAITMNIIANMLGLGNAATPLGIKAMKELQELNPHKDRATDAMCMFLVINTSSVQLIPATVVALRSTAGSSNPTEIIGTAFIATVCSTAAGIIAAKILQRYY
ncbi:nucleoside recognition protein [Caldicoprobacter algeriensis]|uniref:nucleoside recognition domain-containing protein n=1 Tax=Caldicoprobacter algeriensis TaxID=699281 RepID=UPI002079A176|nr:nucleoside recognition domain-containing protein [Caldicoprobacter algeriensis]MCM8901849.1 nucleoside recognition protein [Caldicoprobacter algeriensis]